MRKQAIRYIEQKTEGNANLDDRGPAVVAKVKFSNSGLSIYHGDKMFLRNPTRGGPGNCYCLQDGNQYWISGVKKRGTNRHWAGGGDVVLEVTPEELERELRGDTA
jgi:hypothetical protein